MTVSGQFASWISILMISFQLKDPRWMSINLPMNFYLDTLIEISDRTRSFYKYLEPVYIRMAIFLETASGKFRYDFIPGASRPYTFQVYHVYF